MSSIKNPYLDYLRQQRAAQQPSAPSVGLDLGAQQPVPQPSAAPQAASAPPEQPQGDSAPLVNPYLDYLRAQKQPAIAPAQEPAAEQPGRAASILSSVAQGAVQTLTDIPREIGVRRSRGPIDDLVFFGAVDKGADLGRLALGAKTPRQIKYLSADEKTRAAMREEVAGKIKAPQSDAFYQAGEAIDSWLREQLPTNPEYEKEFWSGKAPQALGSMLGFIGETLALRPIGRRAGLSKNASGLAGASAAGSASQAVSGFQDAVEKGASIEDAYKSHDLNQVIGLSEGLPIASLLDRVDKGTGGVIRRALVNGMKSGTEESAQETFSNVLSNLIASDVVKYDPARGVWEGTGENAALGFTTGGLVSVLGTLMFGRRARGGAEDNQIPLAPEQQAAAAALLEPDAPVAQQQPAAQPQQPQTAGPSSQQAPEAQPQPAVPVEPQQGIPVPPQPAAQPQAAATPITPIEEAPSAQEVRSDQGQVDLARGLGEGGQIQGSGDLQLQPQEGPAASDQQAGPQAAQQAAQQVAPEVVPPIVTQEAPAAEQQVVSPIAPDMAQESAPEALPEAAQAELAVDRPPIEARPAPEPDDIAVTAAGTEVPVRYAVVEADDLVASQTDDGRTNRDYPQALQPRDRSRGVSGEQVRSIAETLNPRLLDRSPRASDGAPIVSAGGVVESGNGRVLAIRQAYRRGLPTAAAYRQHLAAQGYPVEGMTNPVLVRVRSGEMTPAQRMAFARQANERDTLAMSATEQAMADAQAMPAGLLEQYRGGDVDDVANRDFVRGFLGAVAGRNDLATLVSRGGEVSQDAVRRIQGALLAKAYGDADLVSALVESTDANIKAIGGALLDVAPAWAQMRAAVSDGAIDASMDQTERLLDAVRLVQRARRERVGLGNLVGQSDMLSGNAVHPVAEAFLRLMYRDTARWSRPVGRDRLGDALRHYLDMARRAQPGVDLLGDTAPAPEQILSTAREATIGQDQQAEQATADIFAQPAGRAGGDVRLAGKKRAASKIPGSEAPRGEQAAGVGKSAITAETDVEAGPKRETGKAKAKRGAAAKAKKSDESGKAPAAPKTSKSDLPMFSRRKRDETRDLIVQHNLTAENVLHADRMGGLAVPSLAVTTVTRPLNNFGGITLLGDRDLADPRRGTQVFGADIYSPRYPTVTYKLDAAARSRLEAALKPHVEKLGDGVGTVTRLDDLTDSRAFRRYAEKLAGHETNYDERVGIAEQLLLEVGANETLFKGFTNTGRRYVPHTLENVVKALKKELRGGEGFNYGLPNLRAKVTPRFRSVEAIRKSKDKLVTRADFEAVRDEMNAGLDDLATRISADIGSYRSTDTVTQVLTDAVSMGIPRALRANNVPAPSIETQQAMARFLSKLRDMPTEYFEAIIPRVVQFSEFKTAVVPTGTDPRAVAVLRKAGLNIVEYEKGNDIQRQIAIEKAAQDDGLLFSRTAPGDTITVDGVERPTRDSEGHMIHPTEEGIRNFWRWFSGSAVVDAEGRPLVVYHGTQSDFSKFKPSRGGEYGSGIYLTPDEGAAWAAAERAGNGAQTIMPVYAAIRWPFITEDRYGARAIGVKRLERQGYDGIIATSPTGERQIVAFRPEQIKSATGNTGAFSPTNPDITASRTAGPSSSRTVSEVESEIAQQLGRRAYAKLRDRFVVVADTDALRADMQRRGSKFTGMLFSGGVLADTITVDGVERPTRNSDGQLIHPTEEGIRNFWRWFSPQPSQLLDGLSVSEIRSLERHTKALADFIERQSSLPKTDRFKVIPRPVLTHMVGVVNNDKILDAVIRSIPVNVVDFLSRKKWSAKEALHDVSVLKDVLAVDPETDVSLGVNPSSYPELAVRLIANAGAKITGLTDGALERNSAVLANENDPVLGAHVAKSPNKDLGILAGFGDSKVVDSDGRPLAVYHGTNIDIEAFDEQRSRDSGIWMTPITGAADAYAGARGLANIMPLYAAITNPYEAKVGEDRHTAVFRAIDNGHDGIIVRDSDGSISTLAAFRPEQIKSATGNTGAFSPTNPDITASRTADDAGLIKGLYDPSTETSYIVAGNMTAQDSAWGTFLHEVGEHYGLDRMLGKAGHANVLRQAEVLLRAGVKPLRAAAEQANAAENVGLDPRAKDFAKQFADRMRQDKRLAREVVAYLAEDPANHNMSLMRRITAAVRAFLRKLGILKNLRTDDIVALVIRAARSAGGFSRRYSGDTDPVGQPLFMRDAGAPDQKPGPVTEADDLNAWAYSLPLAGDTVDGRSVMDHIPNQSSIDATIENNEVIDGVRAVPLSAFDYQPGKPDARTLHLAQQIKESNEIAPLIVAVDDKGIYIIEGAHRIDALIHLGAKELPALVVIDRDAVPAGQPSRDRSPYAAPQDPVGDEGDRAGPLFSRVRGTQEQEQAIEDTIGPAPGEKRFGRFMASIADAIGGVSANSIRQGLFDSFRSIAAYEERANEGRVMDAATSAWKMALTTKNLHTVVTAMMVRGPIELVDGEFRLMRDRKGLIEIFKPLADKGLLRLWEGWAAANRAQRLMAEGREHNFKQEHIDALLALETQYPEFRRVLDEYQEFNKAVLDLAEATGAIDPVARAAWERNDYVPFYRIMEDAQEAMGPPGQRGIAKQRSGIRELRGGEQRIGSVLENIVMNMAHLVDVAYKNEAMRRTVALTEGIGMHAVEKGWRPTMISDVALRRALEAHGVAVGDMTPEQKAEWSRVFARVAPQGSDIVWALEAGKPVYYRVTDPLLLRSVLSFGPKAAGAWMKVLRAGRIALTKGATATPEFMAANFVRDTLATWVVSDRSLIPLWSATKGFFKALTGSGDAVTDIMTMGGMGRGFYDVEPQDLRRSMEEKVGLHPAGIVRTAWRLWQRIGFAFEQANRIAIYDATLKKGGSRAEAAHQARDILDFSMRGDWPAIQFIAETVPFFNARLQGLYKVGRGFADHPAGFFIKGSLLTAATMALLAANNDDDRYAELPEWEKDLYWHFWIGDEHFRLPKPFEIGVLFATIPERTIRASSGKDTAKTTGQAAMRMVLDTFAFNPIPQLFMPVLEDAMNYSVFTGGKVVPTRMQYLPPELQYDPWTSESLRELAKVMPGPSILRSPKRLENLLYGYFGGLSKYLLGITDRMVRAVGDYPEEPESRVTDIRLIGKFYRGATQGPTRYSDVFYDMLDEAEEAANAVRELQRQGRIAEANAAKIDKARVLRARLALSRQSRRLSEINKIARNVYYSTTMTPDQKRARLDELDQEKNRILRSAVLRFEQR